MKQHTIPVAENLSSTTNQTASLVHQQPGEMDIFIRCQICQRRLEVERWRGSHKWGVRAEKALLLAIVLRVSLKGGSQR